MISRRQLIQTAGAAGALAGLPSLVRAQGAGPMLTPGVPAGVGFYATMATLLGKKP
jgi:ABC-type uncharacterized transport system permease subunit